MQVKQICTTVIIAITSGMAYAKPQVIKVAILENLKLEKLSTDKYANDYQDGLQVAVNAAKPTYDIQIKTFFYGKEPLAILEKVPEVKQWNPDIIIGPRSSSLFLMLKGQFSDILVLSPFATANEIASLPDNFYSLTLPNKYFTQAAVNMVRTQFPGQAVAPIVEVDCKNCMDFANAFEDSAKAANITVRTQTTYLNKNAESVPVAELVSQLKESDLVLLPNTSYTSGAVVARLVDFLKRPITVIGGDGWGDWSASYFGKVKSSYAYSGYRLTPWSLDSTDERVHTFLRNFKLVKRGASSGTAALLAYSTLNAPIVALQSTNAPKVSGPIRNQILAAFKAARGKDPNFERPKKYAIYKVTQDGETFAGEAPALNKETKK